MREKRQQKHRRQAQRATMVGTRALLAALVVGLAAMMADHARADHVQVQDIAAGEAEFIRDGDHLQIRAADGTVINYDRFDVPVEQLVEFLQPHEAARVLNRIHSESPSVIEGELQANGIVYFANPAGVIFGPGAMVDAGQFHAVAGEISDADFLSGTDRFITDGGEVVNHGQIVASGDVSLLGSSVTNYGVIYAPQGVVTLAAGDNIYLREQGSTLMLQVDGLNGRTGQSDAPTADDLPDEAGVHNRGEVTGQGAFFAVGDVYSLALRNEGRVAANGGSVHMAGHGRVEQAGEVDVSAADAGGGGVGGDVTLSGEQVVLSGSIDARGRDGGGAVRIGGDEAGGGDLRTARRTHLTSSSAIDAGAIEAGHGGSVVVWSDELTGFYGSINARGGATGGDGGFTEVSSAQILDYRGLVDLGAAAGNRGALLLDPTNITIADAGSSDIASDEGVFSGDGDPSDAVLSVSALEAALGTSDVTITTESPGSGDGDITVADGFSWGGDANLTLLADRQITLGDDVTILHLGAGSLTLRADRLGVGEGAADGTVSFGSGALVDFSSASGDVTILYNVDDYASPADFAGDGHVSIGSGAYHELMLVNTADRLAAMSGNLAGHYALGSDIENVGGSLDDFEPIRDGAGGYFTGTLDGRGHAIRGLHIDSAGPDPVGLFEAVGGDAVVRDLSLEDVDISGDWQVGGVAGVSSGSAEIRGVSVDGEVSGAGAVGGLVGLVAGDSLIVASSADVDASGSGQSVGGLVGLMGNQSEIRESYATGSVSGGHMTGGLAGWAWGDASIMDSYATSTVSGSQQVGGAVGWLSDEASIANVYAAGPVNGSLQVGGLVGTRGEDASISDSFFDTQATGRTDGVGSGSQSGTTGLTSAQMQQEQTFEQAGWDVQNVWVMVNGQTLPAHRWQYQVIRGTAASGETVLLAVNGTQVGSAVANGDGGFGLLVDAGSFAAGNLLLARAENGGGAWTGNTVYLVGVGDPSVSLEASMVQGTAADGAGPLHHGHFATAAGGLDALYNVNNGDLLVEPGFGFLIRGVDYELSGDIATDGGPIAFENSDVRLLGSHALTTGGGDVSFGGTIDGVAAHQQSLNIDTAGDGDVRIEGAIGGSVPMASLVLAPVHDAALVGAVDVQSLETEHLGTLLLWDDVTTAGPVTIGGALVLRDDVAIRTGGASGAGVTFAGPIDGTVDFQQALLVDSYPDGQVSFGGPIGETVPLRSLTVIDSVTEELANASVDGEAVRGAQVAAAQPAAVSRALAILGLGPNVEIDPVFAEVFVNQWDGFAQHRVQRFHQELVALLIEAEVPAVEAAGQLDRGGTLFEDLVEVVTLLNVVEAMGLPDSDLQVAQASLIERLRPNDVQPAQLATVLGSMQQLLSGEVESAG